MQAVIVGGRHELRPQSGGLEAEDGSCREQIGGDKRALGSLFTEFWSISPDTSGEEKRGRGNILNDSKGLYRGWNFSKKAN